MKTLMMILLAVGSSVQKQATDWISLFHGITAVPSDATLFQEYRAAQNRNATEDAAAAQMEVTELAAIYEQHPETRVPISNLLFGAVQTRAPKKDSAEAFKPIFPTLIAHFSDPDRATRAGAIKVFWFLQPSPPSEALAPLASLSYIETDPEAEAMALQVLRRFCTAQSNRQAVSALHDAAMDQDSRKRVTALGVIGQALVGEPLTACTDPELADAILQGLKSGQPNVVRQAASAAHRFNPTTEPLKSELERIAADDANPEAAKTAKEVLSLSR